VRRFFRYGRSAAAALGHGQGQKELLRETLSPDRHKAMICEWAEGAVCASQECAGEGLRGRLGARQRGDAGFMLRYIAPGCSPDLALGGVVAAAQRPRVSRYHS